MQRRDFIKINIGAAALASIPLPALANAVQNPANGLLYKLIYDDQNDQCCDFVQKINTKWVQVEAVSGDLNKLWFGDLWQQIESKPTWVAGATSRNTALMLETITRDYGHSFVQSEKLNSITEITTDNIINVAQTKKRSQIMDELLSHDMNEPVFWVIAPSTINFKGKPWT